MIQFWKQFELRWSSYRFQKICLCFNNLKRKESTSTYKQHILSTNKLFRKEIFYTLVLPKVNDYLVWQKWIVFMFSSTNVSKWLSRDWTVEIGFDHWVTKDLSFFLSLFLPGTQSNFKMKTALVIIVSELLSHYCRHLNVCYGSDRCLQNSTLL